MTITAEQLKKFCGSDTLEGTFPYYDMGDWSKDDEAKFIAEFGEYDSDTYNLGYDDGCQEWKLVITFKNHNQYFATIYYTNSWDNPPWENKWEEVEPYVYSETRYKTKNSK